MTTLNLRLPGLYFLPPPQVAPREWPPLDVAAFVGFAERGPLHLPVPLESMAQYEAIFGGDLAVAREVGGAVTYAYLPGAVRLFFANGGRRCYVVRVAGEDAARTRFILPGMVAISEVGDARQVSLHAAWVGRWSEQLRLATLLRQTPMPAEAFSVVDDHSLAWQAQGATDALQTGDLLAVTVGGDQWWFPIASIAARDERSTTFTLTAHQIWQLVTEIESSPPLLAETVSRLTPDGNEPLDVAASWRSEGDGILLELQGAEAARLRVGDIVQVETHGDQVFLIPVTELRARGAVLSPPGVQVEVRAPALIRLAPTPLPTLSPPGQPDRVERLRFDLLLRQETLKYPAIEDMAFNRSHPRFWGEQVYLASSTLQQPLAARDTGDQAAQAAAIYRLLQTETRLPNEPDELVELAPLAALLAPLDEEAAAATFLPLGMLTLLLEESFQAADEGDVGSDGLDEFNVESFFDPALVSAVGESASGSRLLIEDAFDRFYRRNQRLRGLHSLIFIDEVALVALPDAVHRAWHPADVPPAPPEGTPPPAFDRTDFLICMPAPIVQSVTPAQGHTQGGTHVTLLGEYFTEPAQMLVTFGGAAATGVDVISPTRLTCTTPPHAEGVVDVVVYTPHGAGSLLDAFTYIEPPAARLPWLQTVDDYDESHLRRVQRVLINFCRARQDVVAILTLPLHYARPHCIEWQETLRQELGLPRRRAYFTDARELADLSYAAVYHPWLLVAQGAAGEVRAAPSDGAICGQIALREQRRQVWVAPANQPLQGVLGLLPEFSTGDWAELFELQFNVIRREVREFRPLSAHTLADDRMLYQLSVRRLMILLRKVAQERGMDYVFESHDERFRAGVQFALEEMLQRMYEQGAFAGASPRQAYRVTTDATLNPAQAVEQGRFVAQIQVAPSQPMEFITVLMLRVGDGELQTIEG